MATLNTVSPTAPAALSAGVPSTAAPSNPHADQANATPLGKVRQAASDAGIAEGKGENARPNLVRKLAVWAMQGAISTDDAADLWGRFANAKAKQTGVPYTGKDAKVRASELRTVIAGALRPDFTLCGFTYPECLDIAVDALKDAKQHGYNGLIKIARELNQDNIEPDADSKDKLDVRRDAVRQAMAGVFAEKGEKSNEPKGELEMLDEAEKLLKGILAGTKGSEGKPGRPPYISPEVQDALSKVVARKRQIEPKDAGKKS